MNDGKGSEASGAGGTAGDPLPYLTADLPPIPGRLKERPEDFVVEEIPAYLPSGEGEHLFLWIEKRDISVEFLKRHLSRTLDLSQRDIGMAGIKDRRAVTRQWISVPRRVEPDIGRIETEDLRILEARPHGNKLRTSHLKGNRFSILLRTGNPPRDLATAAAVRERLLEQGLPNFFGEQRFGRQGETLADGLALLRGERRGRTPGWKRRFLLSAVQSWLFNQALGRRMRSKTLHRVLPGDVMQVVVSGGLFVAEEVDAEQERFDRAEIVATGPLFGPKMRSPEAKPAEVEAAILEAAGLSPAMFERHKKLVPGARRPYIVRLERLDVESAPEGLQFDMTLPAGTYATVVLREFTKGAC